MFRFASRENRTRSLVNSYLSLLLEPIASFNPPHHAALAYISATCGWIGSNFTFPSKDSHLFAFKALQVIGQKAREG